MAWKPSKGDDKPIPFKLTPKGLAAATPRRCGTCNGNGSGDRRRPCPSCGRS